MLGQMCFDRFESSGMPATNSTLLILPSTTSYYNQLVIVNRVVRPHLLNARNLNDQNQMTRFAVAFFPVIRPWTTAPPLTVLLCRNTLNLEKDNSPVTDGK